MSAEDAGETSGAVAGGEDALTDSLLVFQCESCRSILGDATNWIAANEALKAFTLSAVTDAVCKGDKLHQSTSSLDAGSSYLTLSCRLCKSELGRYYITTPSQLDHLRDNFTLLVTKVTSYQLGSAGGPDRSKVSCEEPPLLLNVAERLMKLQHVLVAMNDRLCSVERCLSTEPEGD